MTFRKIVAAQPEKRLVIISHPEVELNKNQYQLYQENNSCNGKQVTQVCMFQSRRYFNLLLNKAYGIKKALPAGRAS